MEALLFITTTVVLILLLSLNSFIKKQLKQNSNDVDELKTSLNKITFQLNSMEAKLKKPAEEGLIEKIKSVAAKISKPKEEVLETVIETEAVKPTQEPEVSRVEEKIEEPKLEEIKPQLKEKQVVITAEISKEKITIKKPTFLERNPDLEKFIGENLINKIGIVILVLGLGFLVKYAIDKNWINEIGRVAIGVLSAGLLIGLAHKLQKNYKSFSSVLVGGGLALLYFTISLAYHTEGYPLYQQQTATFLFLILITIFAVFLSVVYNRVEIAILAILGGFSSPLMVSNGSGNYVVFFSYLMLLNVGMLVLSYFKKWRLVNIVAFAFTMLLFSSWLGSELYHNDYASFAGALAFASAFYVIFFLMNIIYNIKYKLDFKAIDITLLLSNTFIYFTFAMIMLSYIADGAYKGLFSILLSTFNFVFAFMIYRRQKTDEKLLFLLVGLVFTFVTLAIPLQLEGNYITLFWSVESVLLLWLGQKSGFKVMKLGSVIVAALMFISLIMDWAANYQIIGFANDDYVKLLPLLINKIFITSFISGVALMATLFLMRKDEETMAYIIPAKIYRALALGATLLIFYVGGFLETFYQAKHFFIESSSQTVAILTFNSLFVLSLLILVHRLKARTLSVVISVVSALFILIFLSSLSSDYFNNLSVFINGSEPLSGLLLVFRWISIIAFYIIAVLFFKLINILNPSRQNGLFKANAVAFVFTLLFLLSADLDAIAVLISKSTDVLDHTQKIGYAILWALSSFVLMIIGMKRKIQIIRVLSLILFAITLIKLFAYDISNISEGGKIVAFILLGILLLIISFMYQKLKKLVVESSLPDAVTVEQNKSIKE